MPRQSGRTLHGRARNRIDSNVTKYFGRLRCEARLAGARHQGFACRPLHVGGCAIDVDVEDADCTHKHGKEQRNPPKENSSGQTDPVQMSRRCVAARWWFEISSVNDVGHGLCVSVAGGRHDVHAWSPRWPW